MNYLKRKNLKVRQFYIVDARNFNLAVWNGEAFVGVREKFGDTFEDVEYHYDEGLPYGTVRPIRKFEY